MCQNLPASFTVCLYTPECSGYFLQFLVLSTNESLLFRAHFQLQIFRHLAVKSPDMQLFYRYHTEKSLRFVLTFHYWLFWIFIARVTIFYVNWFNQKMFFPLYFPRSKVTTYSVLFPFSVSRLPFTNYIYGSRWWSLLSGCPGNSFRCCCTCFT